MSTILMPARSLLKPDRSIIPPGWDGTAAPRPTRRRSAWWRRLIGGRAQFALGGIGGVSPGCCCGGAVGTCPVTICVTGCPSGSEQIGATVVITGVSTCNTVDDGAGHACCSIAIGTAGTYQVTVSKSGYKAWTATRTLACNDTLAVGLQPDTEPATLLFTVAGCCGNHLPGALITLSDGQSCTTDSSGECSFWIGIGATYTYAVSKARFADATGSVTLGECGSTPTDVDVSMEPAAGYACGLGGADPIPTVLSLTDSVYGGCTLTYYTVAPFPALGAPGWMGVIRGASFPGGCNCPATTFDLMYVLYQCGQGLTGFAYYNGAQDFACGFGALQHHCPANPSECSTCGSGEILSNCSDCVDAGDCSIDGSLENGSMSLEGGTGGTTIPFDYSVSLPAATATCFSAESDGIAWLSGATITITE